MEDIRYMNYAIELAERGKGWVNPNPLVGAVVVKEGRIIGEGWHERYGGLHAERNALKNCRENPAGSTMYVTLEPCCHYGKTPPCTEAIIEHQIARVVVGLEDPNPLVAGKGIERLRAAGIEVISGVEEKKLQAQNRVFLKYITTQMPYVILKTAMTLDGKIATRTGHSQWVTGEEARHRVQEMRKTYMGIMVGAGTAKIDDPLLNCRLLGEIRQPIRIILDSAANLSLNSQLVKTAKKYRTIVVHTQRASVDRLMALCKEGVELLLCEEKENHVDLVVMLKQLRSLGIDSILLEGGGELNESFLSHGLVDEVCAFIAPKLIGGREAKTPIEGQGFATMNDAVLLDDVVVECVGKDILICGKVKKDVKK